MISSDWRSQNFEKKKIKKIGGPNLGKWTKIGSEARFFCHFLNFGSLVFF